MQPSAVANSPDKKTSGDNHKDASAPTLLERGLAFAGPVLVFAVALALALWQHFGSGEQRCTFFSDSRHYLESTRLLVEFIYSIPAALSHGAISDIKIPQALADGLMLDGPILPIMPAVYFALAGKFPTQVDWQPFVILESGLHALSAALVFLLAERLTGSRKWAALAGLGWGVYPAAIITSGRFLTETPAVLFLLGLVLAASRVMEYKDERPIASLWAGTTLGVWSGVMLLLKPALLPAWLAVDAAALLFVVPLTSPGMWKLRCRLAAAILTGILFVVLPWACCSKVMTGKVYLTPQRTPVYNAAKGCDIEADGWGALPSTPLTDYMTDTPSVLSPVAIAWRSHPGELVNMSLRKVARLWSAPWNDFRENALSIPVSIQKWWQVILLVLAVPGTLAVLCLLPLRLLPAGAGRAATFVGFASILVILAHLAYLPFEAITRYGFTAMPFVVLLAVYGLNVAARLRGQLAWTPALVIPALAYSTLCTIDFVPELVSFTGDFRSALLLEFCGESLLVACCLVAAISYIRRATSGKVLRVFAGGVVCLAAVGLLSISLAFCIDGRHALEWSSTLGPGQSACRSINLPGNLISSRGADVAAVLIDADSSCANAVVSVNGNKVRSAPDTLLRFRPTHYFLYDIMRTLAGKLGLPVEEIRQWRAVVFPVAWLKEGENEISLAGSGGKPVTIYGEYDDSWSKRRPLRAFDYFSSGLYCNSPVGLDGRLRDPYGLPRVSSKSWLQAGSQIHSADLSSQSGRQTGQYKLLLFLNKSDRIATQVTVQDDMPKARFVKVLSARDFDPQLGNTLMPDAELRINKAILKTVSRLDYQFEIPDSVLRTPYTRIKISGELRAARAPCKVSLLPVIVGGGRAAYSTVLPATPPYLAATSDWTPFEISDILPPDRLPGGLKYLSIALFPGAWEEVREYGCDRRSGDACFRKLKIEIEPASRPMLEGGHPAIY